MGAAITKATGGMALAPQSFDEVMRFAEMLSKSDFVPPAFKNKPGNIIAAVQMGSELGFSPMQAMQNIAVINGKPGVYGDGLLALVQAHPDCEDVIEEKPTAANKMTATCTVKRRGRTPVIGTFSEEDAKKAQLWGKQGPWTQYPKRMLQMRARAFALRDSFPDALHGIGVVEELQDIPVREVKATVVREKPQPQQRPSTPPPALPPHDEATGEVLEDPFAYVMTSGKNAGKALGELTNQQLHWYAEEFRPRNEDGEKVKRFARQVIDTRKREAEVDAAAREAQNARNEQDDGWGLSGDPDPNAAADDDMTTPEIDP